MGGPAARLVLALGLAAGLLLVAPAGAQEARVEFGIGNAGGTQTFQGPVNIGIPPAQLPTIIEAATKPLKELTDQQRQDLERVRTQLQVSAGALDRFLRDIGEAGVPPEEQAVRLAEVAERYKGLLARLEAVGSDDPEVRQLKAAAAKALDAGDFARAEALLNRSKERDLSAVEQMQTAMERMRAALEARKLSAAEAAAQNGDLMMTQLRYAEAARYYAEAVRLTPETYPEPLSDRLTSWGWAALRAGDYGSALEATRRALAVEEAKQPTDDVRLGSRLNNLAFILDEANRYAEAEPLLKRAIAIDEKALGPDQSRLAIDLNNLAELYRATGRYAEAEPLLKRAIAIGEKALGPDQSRLASNLGNLAELYLDTSRYAEAEPLFKRAIAIDEKVFGPDHPFLATGLNDLAELYRATGHYAEAELLHRRVLAIREKALPRDHSDIAQSLNNLAELIGPPAATPRPSRSSSAPWRSGRRRSAPTIQM
jgi:tetratricopeptide (TPR) repeat protein